MALVEEGFGTSLITMTVSIGTREKFLTCITHISAEGAVAGMAEVSNGSVSARRFLKSIVYGDEERGRTEIGQSMEQHSHIFILSI